MNPVIDFTKTFIPSTWKQQATGWISGNCPMCIYNGESRPDTKGRGGFLFGYDDNIKYNCFNCKYHFTWEEGKRVEYQFRRLLMTLGADESDIQRLNLEISKSLVLSGNSDLQKQKSLSVDTHFPDYKAAAMLPEGSYPVKQYPVHTLDDDTKFIAACTYIANRGLLDLADWHYSNSFNFRNRVILPYYFKTELMGFSARWVPSKLPPGTSKYYNLHPHNFVFNLDAQLPDSDYILVVEGPLDAVAIGGVSLGTNTIGDTRAHFIERTGKIPVLIPDMEATGASVAKEAISRGWYVSFPVWADSIKDCALAVEKHGRLFTTKTIFDGVVSNPIKASLLVDKFCRD